MNALRSIPQVSSATVHSPGHSSVLFDGSEALSGIVLEATTTVPMDVVELRDRLLPGLLGRAPTEVVLPPAG